MSQEANKKDINDITAFSNDMEKSHNTSYTRLDQPTETPKSKLRYLILFLGCIIVPCPNIFHTLFFPIENDVISDLKISYTKYAILASSTSYLNIFLPLFGGLIFDSVSRKFSIIIFPFMMALGQLICSIGAVYNSYATLLIGRIIGSLCTDSVFVCVLGYIYWWYNGMDILFEMSILYLIIVIGSTASFALTPLTYNINHSLSLPFWILFGACVLCIICGVIIYTVTSYGEKKGLVVRRSREDRTQLKEMFKKSNYKSTFWIIVTVPFFLYGSFNTLISVLTEYLQKRYGFTNVKVGLIMMVPQIISMIFSPIAGKLLDIFKRLSIFFIIAGSCMTAGKLYFMLVPACDGCYNILPSLILSGLGVAICAPGMWTIPSLLVKPKIAATALGFIKSLGNLGFVVVSLIGGTILDNTKGYFPFLLFLVLIMATGLILLIVVAVYDYYHGLILYKNDVKMNAIQ